MLSIKPRSNRSLAVGIALALYGSAGFAQTSQPQNVTTLEEVVVTGSLIATTAEDTAVPVSVTTYEELLNLGRPSNLDLVRTMPEMGQVAGQTDRYNSFPVGAATVNLRNLGPRFSVVLFNGRRFPEQFSPVTGRFNNIAWIPNAAIGQVDVLKEGGAATYGADAIAGVVNYHTRRDFEGVELNGSYTAIEDSDGDYNADVLWGEKFGDGNNFLISASYQHRSNLAAYDRDWARQPRLINNQDQNWNGFGSPGSMFFQTTPTVTGTAVGTTISPLTGYTGNRQMSVSGVVRDMGCAELGGFASWSATPSPLCYFNITQFEKLVEESDTFQLYGEANFQLTDSLEYHVEGLFHYLDLPDIAAHPSDGPLVFPSLANGSTQVTNTATGASAYFVDGHNPGVANFLNTFRNNGGATTAYTPTQIAAITSTGRAAIPLGTWRPFGNGGNPLTGAYDIQKNTTEFWRLTNELRGDLVGDIKWDVALTYNHIVDRKEIHDMPVQNLQAALNGLGGANCNGIRADLAGSTCQWFNPFSSAIASNFYNGAANPYYVPSLANSNDLVAWLYVPIWLQRVYQDTTLDVLFSGDTGWNMSGGPVAFAAGVQGRYRTEDTTLDDYSNRAINPCATLGQTNCTTETGALAFLRPNTVTGANGSQTPYRPESRYFPAYAAFAEVKLPILENLDVQVSGRYEKFISDITDIDNDVFVPAMSVLWRPIDELRIRASAGQTFSQVNPPSDNGQNYARNVAAVPGFGGFGTSTSSFDTYNYDNLSVKPMKGDYFDVGFVTNIGGFTGSLDWYQISIDDYTRTMTAAQVITAIAGAPFNNMTLPGAVAGVNNDWRLNCASPLLTPQAGLGGRAYAQLAGGVACDANSSLYGAMPGQPLFNSMANGRVNFYGGTDQTNSGTLTTSGIDLSVRYLFDDVLGGQLTPSIEGTYVLSWDLDDFIIGGVKVANGYDGVGFTNGSTGRLGQAIPEWRASFSVNYHLGDHNFNVVARFIPSIVDEDATRANATNTTNANIGDAAGVVPAGAACVGPTVSPPVPAGAGTGAFGTSAGGTVGFCAAQNTSITAGNNKVESMFNIDLVYSIKLPAETTMYLSIYNLTDEDPSFWRGSSLSYASGYGSPLGRTAKLAVSKKF